MPRIIVTTTCIATVTEEWVLDVTPETLAELQTEHAEPAADELDALLRDPLALALIDGAGEYVNVENTRVEDEHDRNVTGWEVVADDFTNEGTR